MILLGKHEEIIKLVNWFRCEYNLFQFSEIISCCSDHEQNRKVFFILRKLNYLLACSQPMVQKQTNPHFKMPTH